MMNKLFIILNPNLGTDTYKNFEAYNKANISVNKIYANSLDNKDISEKNASYYFTRNITVEKQVDLILSYLKGKEDFNEYIFLTDIKDYKIINALKKKWASVFVIALTPKKEIIENKEEGVFDNEILNIYTQADYYINPFIEAAKVNAEFCRLLKLVSYVSNIEGDSVETAPAVCIPRYEEINMFAAYSAMYHSHCMSRAVGACITTIDHDIITTGWNDVPKAGGGVYELGHENHCINFHNTLLDENKKYEKNYKSHTCHKDIMNESIKEEIKTELIAEGVDLGDKEKYIIDAIYKLQIKGLLEFSRSVHAEMHTIIKAAKMVGNKINNSILYVTAFPCHNCARHIVLSGVKVVYYLEPFIKSRAILLHNDSMQLYDEIDYPKFEKDGKVALIPYCGVGGNSFDRFFKREGDLKKKTQEGKKYYTNLK